MQESKRKNYRHPSSEYLYNLIDYGIKAGADEMEAKLKNEYEIGADIRMQKVENVYVSNSVSLYIRIIKREKVIQLSSNNITWNNMKKIISNAIQYSKYIERSTYAGLFHGSSKEFKIVDLDIFDDKIYSINSFTAITLCKQMEAAALDYREAIVSLGASFRALAVNLMLANSTGFIHGYKKSYFSLGLGIQNWNTDPSIVEKSSSRLFFQDLEKPEVLAKKAKYEVAKSTMKKKFRPQIVPAILQPELTQKILEVVFTRISFIFRQGNKFRFHYMPGDKIGNENITIIDDGFIQRKMGTRPFDNEGVPSQKTVVVEKGIIVNNLCNVVTARKCHIQPTGNCDDQGEVGPTNFYLQAGNCSLVQMINSIKRGILLERITEKVLPDQNGDIIYGVTGMWIENGEVVCPRKSVV